MRRTFPHVSIAPGSSPVKKIKGFMAGAVLGAEDEELKPYSAGRMAQQAWRLLHEPDEHTKGAERADPESCPLVSMCPGLQACTHTSYTQIVINWSFCFVLFCKL